MANTMKGIYNRGTAAQPRWYCHYLDLDGIRRHRRLCTGSREEAERLLTQLKERIASGESIPPRVEDPLSEPAELTITEASHLIDELKGATNGHGRGGRA